MIPLLLPQPKHLDYTCEPPYQVCVMEGMEPEASYLLGKQPTLSLAQVLVIIMRRTRFTDQH